MTAMHSLEELLVQSRLISGAQLAIAQRDAQERNRRLAPTLIDLRLIDDRRFAEWMSQVTHLPLIDPLPAGAVESLVRRIPRAIAREYEVLPLAIEQGAMIIATMNPLDTAVIDVLRASTGMPVRPVVAVYGSILELMKRFYPEDALAPTTMPQPKFDPGATLVFGGADVSPGSTTRVLLPSEDTNPAGSESQLDRIERALADLRKRIEQLQERAEEIEGTLSHLLSRGG
jgi:hypothetical protein